MSAAVGTVPRMPPSPQTLKTIRLGGALGREFGRVHRLAVASPAEAVRALCANYPRFRGYMDESDQHGVGYRVLVNDVDLKRLEDIGLPSGRGEIKIMPVIRGANGTADGMLMNGSVGGSSPAAFCALKTIRLGGALGREFGRVHRLAVASPAEAVRALCANFPRFRTYVEESDERGVGYRVLVNKADLPKLDDIHNPSGRAEIKIMPAIRGAGKGGIFEIFAGIALIAASFIPGLNVALWAGASVTLASMAFSVGVSLVLGGVASLLSPHPKTPAQTQASYLFNGPVNTSATGMPVPICYGNLIVGGAVISGGVFTDQVPTTQTGVPGLTATVQETTSGSASTYLLYASWQPAGGATAYDVTVQGSGMAPVTLARTNGTSIYYAVSGEGPYEVLVNPVEANGSYGSTASVWSSFLAG
ncbi:MAG TPA: hypothetical protein PK231_04715 [Acidocella sp.]|nr:hypothetical protein [Acidocella sp.]